jgi:transcriptional regulator
VYSPRAYVETDLAELDRLVAGNPFATLITIRDGVPTATHLPVLYVRDGERVTIRGHWSRANAQWRDAGDALLVVHGPDVYVSPSWYPDKEEEARVPTWNYAVAHIHGTLEVFHDTDALAAIVSELSVRHERAIGSDWRFDPGRDDLRVQLKGIVGFRMEATRIELKLKLNQNHPEANRRGVIRALEAQAGEDARAIVSLMRARLALETVPDDPPSDATTEP